MPLLDCISYCVIGNTLQNTGPKDKVCVFLWGFFVFNICLVFVPLFCVFYRASVSERSKACLPAASPTKNAFVEWVLKVFLCLPC